MCRGRVHDGAAARRSSAVQGRGGCTPAVAGLMLKRLFDGSLALAGLLGSSPLWAIFAALIKLEDGGPIFYRQERVGRGGRTFMALKFRSMKPDAEAGPRAGPATAPDPRRPRLGPVLRATAMDGPPPLWEILRGGTRF